MNTLLLRLYRGSIIAPDSDSGFAQLSAEAGTEEDWRRLVAEAVSAGLVHDPVRLPPGALQCHWHLELTARGFAAAAALLSSGEAK